MALLRLRDGLRGLTVRPEAELCMTRCLPGRDSVVDTFRCNEADVCPEWALSRFAGAPSPPTYAHRLHAGTIFQPAPRRSVPRHGLAPLRPLLRPRQGRFQPGDGVIASRRRRACR